MALIIGLNAFHPDAAACAVADGKLVAAVAEERFGRRVKHAAGFPGHALKAVIEMSGAALGDVDFVAIGNDHNANLKAKLGCVVRTPVESARRVVAHWQRRAGMRSVGELVAQACGAAEADCRFRVVRVEHHLAHLASAFFTSEFDEAAGLSYDGSGDFTTTMWARCYGGKIEVLRRAPVPHSLGFFYTAITQLIGFAGFGEEYKAMGLAAYGEPRYAGLMREVLAMNGGGEFRLNPAYVRPLGRSLAECVNDAGEIVLPPLFTAALARQVGKAPENGAEPGPREKDLAASCQGRFEEVVLGCVRELHRRVGGKNLVTAGGCALNGLCNARILRETPYERGSIQCAAADDGTALGAALYLWHGLLGKERNGAMRHAFWGPAHGEAEMERALRAGGLAYERLDRERLLERTAALLAAGRVVGWYQGRSEWGPRALGNRSILAHPGWPGMKDLINTKIKRREGFRPFAPSVLEDAAPKYFEWGKPSPFMMHVVKVRPEQRTALSAVCHADGTARLHTVSREQNPLFYDLLRAFGRVSGVPVLLNTSFNENEPLVETPTQAVDCFLRTDLDVLCVGPFMSWKEAEG